MGLNPLSAFDDLPDQEEPRDEELHGVVGEEGRNGPRLVGRVAVAGGNHDHPDEGEVGAVGLEATGVGEFVAVDALGLACSVEADVRDADYDVVDEASGGDQAGEPGDDDGRAVAALQEREHGEDHDYGVTVDGHPIARGVR